MVLIQSTSRAAVSIISVEFPSGDDPPTYLSLRELTHPDFWGQDSLYAFAPATMYTSVATLYILEMSAIPPPITLGQGA
ncbi:hypothetical protein ACFLV7_13820 [Chloroflexota bacterium]